MEVQIKENQHDNEYYKKLHFHPEQENFIYELAEYLHLSTPLEISAMRGFLFRACRKWQLRNRRPFSSIMNEGSVERFKFWIQFSSLIIEVTRRVIKGEHELVFERMLGKAYTIYQDQFGND